MQELNESKKKRMIYKTESEEFKKQELSNDINRAISTLGDTERVRVDFYNAEDVRRRIVDYFTACSGAGIYPSVQGLAVHGFGISRQALYQWRSNRDHSNLESARLIDLACDLMADILTNQSLHNNANTIQTMFQLKNNHSFSDKVELEAVQGREDPFERLSVEEIAKRYELPEAEELS